MTGRTAVVTGAGQGIGFAVTEALLEDGWFVVGLDRDENGVLRLRERVGSTGEAVLGDVEDVRTLARAFEVATGAGRQLGAWINNAGVVPEKKLDLIELGELRAVLAINLEAAVIGSKFAIEGFRRHGDGGAIVNISSIHGRVGFPSHVAYDISKAGIDGLTRNIAVQYGAERIRANSVAPGPIRTPHLESSLLTRGDPSVAARRLERATALRRIGLPAEVAAVVAFLVDGRSSYVTGQTIYVDGGWSAQGIAGE